MPIKKTLIAPAGADEPRDDGEMDDTDLEEVVGGGNAPPTGVRETPWSDRTNPPDDDIPSPFV